MPHYNKKGEGKMKGTLSYLITACLLGTLFLITLTPTSSVSREEYPRLEEAMGMITYPEHNAMGKARVGEIDNVMGMINPNNVEELQRLNWSISASRGFHMCYLGINCRPYTVGPYAGQPSSGGSTAPYNWPDNGGPRLPGG